MTIPMRIRRIQRLRAKGWRMPEGVIYVGRPSRWGNPFPTVLVHRNLHEIMDDAAWNALAFPPMVETWNDSAAPAIEWCAQLSVDLFAHALRLMHDGARADYLAPLRGHDLACWCRLDAPCHADVLLELANR
jgi:hypothetical protein